MDISHILNHLGEERHAYYNSVSPPVMQSSNFCFPSVASLRESLKQEYHKPFYTRGFNPTVGILRKKIAALEGTEDALIFSSGSAAIAAGVMSAVQQGSHVIAVSKPYSWTDKLLNEYLSRYGVETTMVDGREVANIEKAIQPNTRLIVLESPNSLTFELQDLKAVAALAKNRGIATLCDNSYSTPLFQKPAGYGIDMVAHSASKYLAGHSDLVAGALCGSRERMDRIMATEYMTIGGIIGPQEAWLMIRGMRTLKLRVERSAASARKVAEFLNGHPKVDNVYYPFLASSPQYELARKQMSGCGGMLSITLKTTSPESIEKFCDGLKRFLLACSWGGHESLAFPLCALYDAHNQRHPGIPWNLIRLYIGLEDADDLINDLRGALDKK